VGREPRRVKTYLTIVIGAFCGLFVGFLQSGHLRSHDWNNHFNQLIWITIGVCIAWMLRLLLNYLGRRQ